VPIRILLVDNETLLRRCLATLLNRRRGLLVVGEVETAAEALDLIQSTEPDVVVVEPDLPEGGPEILAEICRLAPDCAVLVLTGDDDPGRASRTLRAGARGYIRKTCELSDLARAIERVHAGELMVASVEASAVLSELGSETSQEPGLSSLTPREMDILKPIARGRTNSAIAQELSITEHTVKGHLARILSKLELENRVQLAAYATQQGLVDPSDDDGSTRRT
jgi:DNA-binding NarL/FixJ family response regulator